ncbi:hypothetical protein I6A84_16730 [Frankia sp. CNm7]|uniref:Uncharacterized protein n=1 Tax=Frankia nepalensis TaxID=1836974 RepID=A0A937R8P4_9ACTN|nr:hypothetical protein [Frankia nepalensis]MBL7501852.1 hypothetical protein [Frankia nepalensis]MBL7511694.1 hypothetical protein [Frankia nepalensis]MBL7519699.1 hypothetical protein [Frankia nepalensis]MBL7625940.1 hypothetical protein [Frankia nepalensis]
MATQRTRRIPGLILTALLLAAGAASLAVGLIKGPDWGWGDGDTIQRLVVGAALLLVGLGRLPDRTDRVRTDGTGTARTDTERRDAAESAPSASDP